MENISLVLDTSLKLVPAYSRWMFFWIILIITVAAVIGNCFAIVSIARRKQKCLHKVSVISLALSDIFSVTIFATNNLDTLSRELKTWQLGEFLCQFIPMGQVIGTTASSIALLIIALDRYQNVTVAIVSQRWNPNMWKCTAVAFICLALCTVTSYPMYVLFTYNPIEVVHTGGSELLFEYTHLCVCIEKGKLKLYYTVMAFMIFLPVVVIFIWFYYQIAAMIWRHRKPIVARCNHSKSSPSRFIAKKTKTAQVQRKIRTFKVIIVLMVAFLVCRLPYWIYSVVKLVETISGSTMWYFHFSLTCLNMLSCALNPFLYAFLNQTIYAAKKCHSFACQVALCCCCFTIKDLETFRNESLFVINCEDNKNDTGKNTKIKFVDAIHFPKYANGP